MRLFTLRPGIGPLGSYSYTKRKTKRNTQSKQNEENQTYWDYLLWGPGSGTWGVATQRRKQKENTKIKQKWKQRGGNLLGLSTLRPGIGYLGSYSYTQSKAKIKQQENQKRKKWKRKIYWDYLLWDRGSGTWEEQKRKKVKQKKKLLLGLSTLKPVITYAYLFYQGKNPIRTLKGSTFGENDILAVQNIDTFIAKNAGVSAAVLDKRCWW